MSRARASNAVLAKHSPDMKAFGSMEESCASLGFDLPLDLQEVRQESLAGKEGGSDLKFRRAARG